MKKIILAVFTLLILLVIGLLVGPSFIDWNQHKARIIAEAEKASGYNIDITGDLSLTLFPAPTLKVDGLIVEAPKKVKFENLVSVKSTEVSVQLMPLLQKKVDVSKVTLIDPVVNVELFKDGTGSWMNKKMLAASAVVKATGETGEAIAKHTASNALDSIALNRVDIKNGQLSVYDHKKDAAHNVGNINTTLNARTLKGPYGLKGNLDYNEKSIGLDLQVGAFDPVKDNIDIKGAVSLIKEKAEVQYNGVVSTKMPLDAQGQVKLSLDNMALLSAAAPSQKASIEGLLTFTEDKIEIDDLISFLGDARGTGKFSVANYKQKNPVNLLIDLKFNQAVDLNSFGAKSQSGNAGTSTDSSSKTSSKEKGLVPSSLTLPMAVDAQVTLDAPSVKIDSKTYDGVFVSVMKKGAKTTASLKALGLPGQGKVEGRADVAFGSSSVSPKSGVVTYADPSVTFVAEGNVGQVEKALAAFAPKVDKKTARMFKTAQFDLKGNVSNQSISLKDSVIKLDDTVIGVGGRYTPATDGGRAKAIIDISAGDLDLDALTGKKQSAPSQAEDGSASTAAKSGNAKSALKPLQDLDLPLDLIFDVSIQNLRTGGVDIAGVRLTGESAGNKLILKNVSVNDYQGASLSAKGTIADRKALSGLDLDLGLKTKDIQKFAKVMKADASKLPSTLKSVEANVGLKGNIDTLKMDTKVKAMRGQLDIAGLVKDALGAPSINDMSIGLKHPNLAQAIKVVSPDFKESPAVSQAVNFSTKAAMNGKVIDLSDIKATLGRNNFSGNIKIDQGAAKPTVTGSISASTLELDQLLGAKSSTSKSSSTSGGSSSNSSKSRWSKSAINVDWMNNMNVNLNLAAKAITYGKWHFEKPSTAIKVQDGTMTVKGLEAGVFGGKATLNTTVKAPAQSGGALSLNMDSAMNGISLEALAGALSNSKRLRSSGIVSFSFDVNSAGKSAHDLINVLGGKAALDGTNVIIKGFDLNKMARGLAVEEKLADSVSSLVDGSLQGGQTQFDTIKGDYKITKGIVNITEMYMDSEQSRIDSTGLANLPNWTINTDHKITLKNVPDLEPFSVKIKGPLDNPANTFGTNVLEDYLGAKIRRKLQKELPDVLGDDVSNTLEQLGILPQRQKTQPAPVNNNTGSEAQPVQEQPKQQTAPKKIEKPEDALKELFGSDNPDDAVNNVLKGLF
ncbi:MAG: AsmA family protein [Alphaproteobacteria bacterium]|nr:AsmA family protein [Alphaproteobacteria bacterium]